MHPFFMKYTIIFLLLISVATQSFSQPKSVRKLPHPLNQPSLNAYAPYISFDGNAMVFLNDYTDDGNLALNYSKRTGADWSPPVILPRTYSNMLTFVKGFTLSPDGQTLFLTSQLSNGIGSFDIYSCTLKGSTFSAPVNIGLPVNSRLNDASPSITADGMTMYFMRCETMNSKQAGRCKIMVSKKQPGGRWSEAIELPATINTGNSQTPRIMADGETLIFASNILQPNKGGMDLYQSRLVDNVWTQPVPLTFVNTNEDDQFVSVTGQGQYLLRDTKADRRYELTEYLFPAELKPRGVLRIDGKVNDAAIPVYVLVNDVSTGKQVYNARPNKDGTFTTFLVEGSTYELAVEPENGSVIYSSKLFDIKEGFPRPFERYTANVKQATVNDEVLLNAVNFKPNSSVLEKNTAFTNEMRRLSRLLKSNSGMMAELQIELQGYVEDSIQSSPDLTEIRIDSVEYYIDEIDSVGNLYKRDTIIAEYTYHNDRTIKQAEAVVEQLVALGCSRDGIVYVTGVKPEAVLENRKLLIKAVLRKK